MSASVSARSGAVKATSEAERLLDLLRARRPQRRLSATGGDGCLVRRPNNSETVSPTSTVTEKPGDQRCNIELVCA